ncbi:membrane-associated protein, putative, partial [Bodo saltans]
SSACPAQFAVLMVWALVPLLPQCVYRLHVLRRPPSNVLSVASSLLAVCIVACNAVFFEGPASLGDGARSALSVFGYMLTVVSGLKFVTSISGIVIEKYVRKKMKSMMKLGKHISRAPLASQSFKTNDVIDALWGEDLNGDSHPVHNSSLQLGVSSNSASGLLELKSVHDTTASRRDPVESFLSSPVHSFVFDQQHRNHSVSTVDFRCIPTVPFCDLPLDVQLEVAHLDVLICDAIVQARDGNSPLTQRRAQAVLDCLVQRISIVAIASAGGGARSHQDIRTR